MELNMQKPANFHIAYSLMDAKDLAKLPVPQYLAIAKHDILQWAINYMDHLENTVTTEVCKCEWIVNPADVNIRPLCCRNCEHPRDAHKADDATGMVLCQGEPVKGTFVKFDEDDEIDCGCNNYSPRQIRRGTPSPECPVHDPVGRMLGFFEYVFTETAKKEDATGESYALVENKTCRTPTCPNSADPNFDGYCSPEHATDEGEMTGEPKGIFPAVEMTTEQAQEFVTEFSKKYPKITVHKEQSP